jgi:FMN phosphatase YigB (HAD superfamily)
MLEVMIRAIFFDFYSVWLPNPFGEYLEQARQRDPVVASELEAVIGQYFEGKVDAAYVAEALRVRLNRQEVTTEQFLLRESDISPEVANFMRELHGHFVKLGVLANLGLQEYSLLTNFNNHNQLFEVITGPLPLHLRLPLLSQEVFAAALQQIGEPPQSCLVVTGDLNYQRFAESLGIMALPFQGLSKLMQTIEDELAREIPQ